MNREEIKELIPHREPMLLVDEMNIDGDWVNAKYHVTGEEFFLKGHLPGHPTVPGVILCEIMGQSCTLLVGEFLKGKTPFYAGLDQVKFKNSVHPGDTVTVRATITQRRGMVFFIDATAKVDDKVVCTGKLSFILVPNEKLDSLQNNEK